MSNTKFEAIAQQIAAGTITAQEIVDYHCSDLTSEEKVALLTALAEKEVADNTPKTAASETSGLLAGGGDPLIIGDFLAGMIQFIDTDNSAQVNLGGTHQFATDNEGQQYPEGSDISWEAVPGKFYTGKQFTIPAGVTAFYTFVLNS